MITNIAAIVTSIILTNSVPEYNGGRECEPALLSIGTLTCHNFWGLDNCQHRIIPPTEKTVITTVTKYTTYAIYGRDSKGQRYRVETTHEEVLSESLQRFRLKETKPKWIPVVQEFKIGDVDPPMLKMSGSWYGPDL